MTALLDSVIIRSDQPTTCPFCGARTDIILDLGHTVEGTQIHQCLAVAEHIFVEVNDNNK